MDGNNGNDVLYAEDRPYAEGQLPPVRRFKSIAPGFFQTMGTPLIAGRDLSWNDLYQKRPVTLISLNLARELWGDPSAAIGSLWR
jgi:putative ABC transport system permease protein